MPEYAWSYDKRQDFGYVSYYTLREVNLQVDEYLLKDRCIQNRVKDKYNYNFGKIIILFNYCKNSIWNIGFDISVWYQSSGYS